jgi:hypothetical protein
MATLKAKGLGEKNLALFISNRRSTAELQPLNGADGNRTRDHLCTYRFMRLQRHALSQIVTHK